MTFQTNFISRLYFESTVIEYISTLRFRANFGLEYLAFRAVMGLEV